MTALRAEGLKSSVGGDLSISTGGLTAPVCGASGGWAIAAMLASHDNSARVKYEFFTEPPWFV